MHRHKSVEALRTYERVSRFPDKGMCAVLGDKVDAPPSSSSVLNCKAIIQLQEM